MHEPGRHDPEYPGDEYGSHTTLRPINADRAADYIDRLFGRMADLSAPAPRPSDPPLSGQPAEQTSLLNDLKDMGWFDS